METATASLPLWNYRTAENDEAGDPLDFGTVRALDVENALKLLSSHLGEVSGADTLDVYLYAIADVAEGVLPNRGDRELHTVHCRS